MEGLTFIEAMIKGLGLSSACVIALIFVGLLYRMNERKDRVIENAVKANTQVLIEMKTLLTTIAAQR